MRIIKNMTLEKATKSTATLTVLLSVLPFCCWRLASLSFLTEFFCLVVILLLTPALIIAGLIILVRILVLKNRPDRTALLGWNLFGLLIGIGVEFYTLHAMPNMLPCQ